MKMIKVSHTQESYKKCSLTQCSLEEICICQSNYFQFGINHIQSVLIQTAATIHKSQYFLENAILLYSCMSLYILYIYTHRHTFIGKHVISQISPNGIMHFKKKKSVHEYGQINRSGWGLGA